MKTVIFDIDGTIADNTHRQHYLLPPLVDKNTQTIFDSESCRCACYYCLNYVGEPHGENCPLVKKSGWKKDWTSFFDPKEQIKDLPVLPLQKIYHALKQISYQIVFLTSRPESSREVTTEWLDMHGFNLYDDLILRPENDHTDDHLLKIEQASSRIGLSNIAFVFEDRQRIVRAWRDAGVFCFHVGGGDF